MLRVVLKPQRGFVVAAEVHRLRRNDLQCSIALGSVLGIERFERKDVYPEPDEARPHDDSER